MVKKYSIGIAYKHPICPIGLSHDRVFVVADTFARLKQTQGYNVIMPIATHYSGKDIIRISKQLFRYLKGEKCDVSRDSIICITYKL